MKIVDYIHAPDAHEGFVLASFCLQTAEPDSIMRELIQAGAVIKVAENDGRRSDGLPICSGWAAKHDGSLTYCYVKHDLRALPIIPLLLDALEVDTGDEIPVRFLTRQMKAIARHWNLRFVPLRGTN